MEDIESSETNEIPDGYTMVPLPGDEVADIRDIATAKAEDAEELRAFCDEIDAIVEKERAEGTPHFPPDFKTRELTKEDRMIWRKFQAFKASEDRNFDPEKIEEFLEKFGEHHESIWKSFDEGGDVKLTASMLFDGYIGGKLTPYSLKLNSQGMDEGKIAA